MILTRAPLRITLGGGGTDTPHYYERHGGMCIAAAIDKYVYIAVHRRTDARLVVKYSKMEDVACVDELQHPIVREALKLVGLDGRGLEIVSFADIPAGTGLGSSGSFTVALLKALRALKREIRTAQQMAEDACRIEIDILKEPIGKQDQYIAAFGGVTQFLFGGGGPVYFGGTDINPIPATDALEDNLLLFFTGYSRSASDVLKSGNEALKADDGEVIRRLHEAKSNAEFALKAIASGDTEQLAALLSESWNVKRKQPGMSCRGINECYDNAMLRGALGGKLVGAGGGGFLLFVARDKKALRECMAFWNCPETRFRVDFEGVKLLSI